MSFGNLRAWAVVLLALGLLGLALAQTLRQQRRLGHWIHPALWGSVIPAFSGRIFRLRQAFLILAVLFCGFALLRPQWGQREESVDSRGMDIVFLLDLSNSMLAEDTPPSRLDRARSFIKKTLEGLADDRVGIVGFAGKAFLTVPLTTDFGYVTEMTETLEPSMIASQGTEIAKAIDTAIKAFERSAEDTRKSSKAFILITDGEDFGEGASEAAAKIRDFGGGFFVVAVGSREGAPIPVRNASGVLQTYKKDREQKVVLSRVNKELLSKIAGDGGGALIDLVNADDASYELIRGLRGLSRDSTQQHRQIVRIERFHYFLALGILFLILHLFTGVRRKGFNPAAALMILLPPLLLSEARGEGIPTYLRSRKALGHYQAKEYAEASTLYGEALKKDPENGALKFNQATALAHENKREEAQPLFDQVGRSALSEGDYSLAAKALYNEGLAWMQSEKMEESIDRLTKSIELAKVTGDTELERLGRLALLRSAQKQQEQNKKQNDDQKQDQKRDQKQDQKQDSKQDADRKQDQKQDQKQDKKNGSQGSKSPLRAEEGKRRQYQGTLSKDVAEGIMSDLSDREKQLHQHRLKDQKGRETENDKDW